MLSLNWTGLQRQNKSQSTEGRPHTLTRVLGATLFLIPNSRIETGLSNRQNQKRDVYLRTPPDVDATTNNCDADSKRGLCRRLTCNARPPDEDTGDDNV